MSERTTTIMCRLFGVNTMVEHSSTQTHQGITIDEEETMTTTATTTTTMMTTTPSRKRKTTSLIQEEEEKEEEIAAKRKQDFLLDLELKLGQPVPKKPRILRLFGVDINVDHLFPPTTTTSAEAQGIATNHNVENPNFANQQQQEVEAEDIAIDHNAENPNFAHQQRQELEAEDIAIDHNAENPNFAHQQQQEAEAEDQDIAIHHNAENPNLGHQQEEEEEEEEEWAGPRIVLGRHPVMLFEKELTSSDVGRGHNRFLITGTRRLMEALSKEEREKVELNEGDSLRVVTTATNGDEYTLRLKKWASSRALVLKHEWNKLVRDNQLQKGDLVQGWGYRLYGEFRLLLHKIIN